MFFYFHKILWGLVQPSALIALLSVLGLALWRRPIGKRLLMAGAALYLVAGVLPLGNVLLIPLERAVPIAAASELDDLSGIIVLGGAIDMAVSSANHGISLNDAGERMTEAVRLARALPGIPLIFSGGRWPPAADGKSEADLARIFFADFGLEGDRLKFEDHSRNTEENASFLAKMLKPTPGQKWLVVTSAFHMPRAKALLEANGFHVVPWPVDYRTRGWPDAFRLFARPHEGLRRVYVSLNEWFGLAFYALKGKISSTSLITLFTA